MAMYDNLKIASYAAAANAFDKSQNLFEGFLPLVETVLCSNGDMKSVSFLGLQQQINEIYGVKIPKDTLKYLINILETQQKVEFTHKKTISPTKDWLSEAIRTVDTHKSSTNVLFQRFRDYLSENECSVSISNISSQVCEWIYRHSFDLAKFITSGADKTAIQVMDNSDWEYADFLIAFLVECYEKHPSVYRSFIGVYDGAVQASLLNFTPKELSSVVNREFIVKNVVLDTNFILRLFGLQPPLDNEVAQSTFQSLREIGVNFYALPQTIEEVCSSVEGFLWETEPVAQQVAAFLPKTSISTTGFWSALQSGVSRTDFLEWTNPVNVARKLSEQFFVTIIEDYEEPNIAKDKIDSLILFKDIDKYGEKQAKHDLTLIAYCQSRRSKRPQPIEEAEWWVLTNDARLAQWERRNSTSNCQACMTGVQISNFLWLFTKKDGGEGLTNTILSLAGRDAASATDISNFALCMNRFGEKHSDDPRALEDLSNVVAHAVLSTNDVKVGGAGDEEFLNVIDQKINEIRLQQKLKEKSDKALVDGHAQEIATLKREIELGKLQSIRSQKKNDIKAAEASISKIGISISQVKELQKVCNEQKHSVTQKLLAQFVGVAVCAVIVAICIALAISRGPFKDFIQQFVAFADLVATLTGWGIAIVIPSGLYYILVTSHFDTPYSPAELFCELQRKNLEKKRGEYIITHQLSSEFASGSLEKHLECLEDQLKQEESSRALLEEDIERINDEIERLRR